MAVDTPAATDRMPMINRGRGSTERAPRGMLAATEEAS
jgi:hypothetical protein